MLNEFSYSCSITRPECYEFKMNEFRSTTVDLSVLYCTTDKLLRIFYIAFAVFGIVYIRTDVSLCVVFLL